MEPLSSDGMWNIVSSLDHEYRCQTNYEKRALQLIQSGYVPEADFLAIMPKSEIPSWFPNRGFISSNESGTLEYELVVEIPPYFRASNWCGLAICLEIKDRSTCDKLVISWSCKASEDYHVCKDWENEISLAYAWHPRLCLMLLDFNEKTCWQHLRGGNDCLHIKLSIRCQYSKSPQLKYGWWALCKEEMQE
ncbi:hypothetical protein QN277_016599 [Acacia crassicarpa]|nr:hypothetical protein QN277_016599 [Acacia crassicarpa]